MLGFVKNNLMNQYVLETDPRKRGIDVGAILGWVGNDIAIIAILL